MAGPCREHVLGSASRPPSSHRALRAGGSRGPDDGRGLLRVLRSHAGVTVCARICKWAPGGRGKGIDLQGAPHLASKPALSLTH